MRKSQRTKDIVDIMSVRPVSSNVVYYDTEFSDLNPYSGELLSVGMVKPSGDELYIEIEHAGSVSKWAAEHVVPQLTSRKHSRDEAKNMIRSFLGNERPYLVGYINQYDDVYLTKLFWGEDKPYHWVPLDVATLLFALGIDPIGDVYEILGLGSWDHEEHHALFDAKWVKAVYERLLELT